MSNHIKNYHYEIIGGILCLILGMLSGYFSGSGDTIWYMNLNKPNFNPPSWLFGPVWATLYLMIGAVLGILLKDKEQSKKLLIIFIIQFIFNLLWSPTFFYFQQIGLALINLMIIWFCSVIFLFCSRKKKKIFLLFLPYTLWISFALILNFSIYNIN